MKDRTGTLSRAPHPVDNVHPVSDTTAPQGALLVDFDSVLGEDRKPFDQTKPGTTVTATVTVQSISPLAGGHARGIVVGEGGWAIFYVAAGFMPRLADVLIKGAKVKIRGTHDLVGTLPTLDVFAARQVNV